MSHTTRKSNRTLRLVQFALLTAVTLLLQTTGTFLPIKFLGTNLNFTLIPIVLAAILLGPAAGALLGFISGLFVYVVGGVLGADVFTSFMFINQPVITACICLIKTTAAGFLAGWVYRWLEKKNELLAVFLTAAVVPVVNTGLFVLGALCILGTIEAFMTFAGIEGQTAIYFIFIGCAGINFLLELAINLVLAPALHRIIHIVTRRIRK